MINIGRLDERKAYIIVEDYLEIVGENCCSLYCLSDSTVQMALAAIMVFDWNSRWLTRDGIYIDRVSPESFQMYRMSFFEKAIKELTMSCDDAIKDGLQAVADAILAGLTALGGGMTSDGGCGCSGNLPNGGNGSGHSGTSPISPSTGSDNGSDDFPPGFDTYDDYHNYKCAVATDIVNKYVHDVVAMDGLVPILTVLLDVATELALLLILDIPADTILLIAGVLVAVWAEEAGWLGNFEDAVTAVKDQLICALFSSANVSTAKSNFANVINPEIETQVGDPIGDYLIKQLAGYMLGNDELNKLFEKDETRTYPEGDCSGCGVLADCLFLTYGFIDSIELAEGYDGVIHAHVAEGGGYGCTDANQHTIRIECPCAVTVHLDALGSITNPPICDVLYVYDVMDTTLQFSGDSLVDFSVPEGGGFYIFTSNAVNIDIYFTND